MYLFTLEEEKEIEQCIKISNDFIPRGYRNQLNFRNLRGLNITNIVDTFCETGRKLFLLRKGIDFGPSIDMVRGSAIHTLIEKVFKNFLSDEISSRDDLLIFINKLKDDSRLMEIIWEGDGLFKLKEAINDKEGYQRTLEELKQTLGNIIQIEIMRLLNNGAYSKDVRILELEDYIDGQSFKLGHGKVDAVLNWKDKIGICDLKSSAPYGGNDSAKYQITLYAMMMEAEHNIEVNWGAIVFPYEKINKKKVLSNNPIKVIFSIDEEIRKRTLKHVGNMNAIVQSDELPPMCRWQCNYCNAREICERGL